MPVTTVQHTLIQQLRKAYPQQFKSTNNGPLLIRVDDRQSDDSYPGFCDIHLRMSAPDADDFSLILDNIPFDDDVKAAISELTITWQTTRTGERLTLNCSPRGRDQIIRLAKAIRQVVGRGKSYPDRNWKWIAPRTAKSLEQLARAISKAT